MSPIVKAPVRKLPANAVAEKTRSSVPADAARRTGPAVQPASCAQQQPEAVAAALPDLFDTAWRYQLDFWQRSVLFMDTLRERANIMLEHERAGMPPVLDFEYEVILDARRFSRSTNYALLKITAAEGSCLDACVDERKRPVMVVDPRAGHEPGIGGFKRDSEVGMAMHEGHPVYFVIFYPEPCPGQTLADVLHALRRFVQEVSRRHGNVAPVLYEMKIDNPTGNPDCRKPQYAVHFEERRVEDLRCDYPAAAFERVRQVSELNALLYETYLGRWVRALSTPWSAAVLKWMHPIRSRRDHASGCRN